ncbi:seed maturation protein [Striga asiatica]|uniref:Seed maturation protein n=1 Tax=Striga asiatica TaxID=4170 RepID=A0A5A7PCD7_STRAF|nr:seed maturation protein [Striga asiatica]
MHSTKQKVSDAAAVAKEHVDILKAKAQEKAEKGMARSKEEKEVAHEVRKAKEAEAKMKMHETKAQNAQDKLYGEHHGLYGKHHHQPVGSAFPATGGVAPAYPPTDPTLK